MLGKGRPYRAFISYSHAADDRLAPALQSGLQQLAKPWYSLRALRVFRDKTSLSVTPALWPSIEKALGESDYFVYLASPEAAESPWVRREIEFWLARRSPETLLTLLTGGELRWDEATEDFDWGRTSSVPPILKGQFRAEPLWLDLRWASTAEDLSLRNPRFRDEIAGLAATLHGRPKDEIVGEDVRQHRRTRVIAWAAVVALLVLTVASVAAAWIAVGQRDAAVRNLARSYLEAGARAYGDRDVLAAEEAYVRALNARDDLATRERLLEVRSRGMSLRWQAPGAGGTTLAAMSRDGQRIALGRSNEVDVRDLTSGERVLALPIDGTPTALAFDHGGRHLAIGGARGGLQIWDLARRRRLLDVQGHETAVEAVAFRPGLEWLSVGNDNRVKLWTPGRAAPTWSRAIDGPALTRAAFVSSSQRLLLGNVAGQVRMEPLRGGRAILDVTAHANAIGALALSLDGRRLATWGSGKQSSGVRDTKVKVWSLADPSRPVLLAGEPGFPPGHSLVFSPDGRKLMTGKIAGGFDVWNAETGSLERSLGGGDAVPFLEPLPGERGVVSAGSGLALWNLGDGSVREIASGHGHSVQGVAVSPDGRTAFSASFDQTLRAWDLATGAHRATWRAGDKLHDVRLSPDGTAVATCGAQITLRESATGDVVWSKPGYVYPFRGCLAFSADGKELYVATGAGAVVEISAADGTETARLPLAGNAGPVGSLDAAGGVLAAVASDGRVVVFEPALRRIRSELRGLSSEDGAKGLAVSADGSRVAVATRAAIYVWTLTASDTPRVARLPGVAGGNDLQSIAFTRDGLRLLTTGRGELSLWDAVTLRRLAVARPNGGRAGWLNGTAVTPDGRSVIVGLDDGTVAAWRFEESEEVRTYRGQHGLLLKWAWSADGRRIAAIDAAPGGTNHVVLFDESAAQPVATIESPGGGFSDLAFDDTGRRLFAGLATGSDGPGTVRIWDVTARSWLPPVATLDDAPRALALSPDGGLLAAAGGRTNGEAASTIVLLDPSSLAERRRLARHTRGIETLRFSSDGRHLWSGGLDSRAVEWAVAEPWLPRELPLHGGTVTGTALSPDGHLVATASRDGSLRVFEAQGRLREHWFAHREGYGYAEDVDFSPDGRLLASAGGNGQAVLWQIGGWQRLVALRGHEDPWIQSSRFDTAGRQLLTRAHEGWIKVWNLEQVRRLLAASPRELAEETARRTGRTVDVDTSTW
jgi:WD40 repeat protein